MHECERLLFRDDQIQRSLLMKLPQTDPVLDFKFQKAYAAKRDSEIFGKRRRAFRARRRSILVQRRFR